MNMDFRGERILVTGGAGFIGSHLTDRLVEMGAHVTVLDNFATGKKSNLSRSLRDVRIIDGDITSRRTMRQFKRLDIIFHLAAGRLLPSFESPEGDLRVNTFGTLRVIDCARRCDAKLVYASTGSVYGNPEHVPIPEDARLSPISPYAISKLAGEMYVRLASKMYGLPTVCLRYFNVYGPRQSLSKGVGVVPRFVNLALRNKPLTIFGTGKQSRDFTYVSDIVGATLAASQATNLDGRVFNAGTGAECTIRSLAQIVIGVSNSRSSTIFEERKPGDIDRLCADIEFARRIIGYTPKVSLHEGVRFLVQHLS
jgi:UDP-glucose 4-epimerase